MSDRWSWVPHVWGLFTPTFTLACLALGGWWMAAPLIVFLGFYPLLEMVLGQSPETRPLQEGRAHDVIVHLHAIAVPLVLGVLLWRISLDGLTILTGLGIASAGLNNGASGIVAAHELGHRRPRSKSWWTARLTLFSVLYLHFTTEHNHTHHRHWARDVDPTSSPWGRRHPPCARATPHRRRHRAKTQVLACWRPMRASRDVAGCGLMQAMPSAQLWT